MSVRRTTPPVELPVQRLTLPMSASAQSESRTVNSFVLPGRPVTLVDAGMPFPESVGALERQLAARGARPADVEQLVISHMHPDHYGGASAIVRAAASAGRTVRVLAHPRAAAMMDDLSAWWQRAREHSLWLLRRSGVPAAMLERSDWSRAPRSPLADASLGVRVTTTIADGAVVESDAGPWRVLHTPGHASTQICLYQPDGGALLSSDHVLPAVTASMVLEPPADGEVPSHPILDYLASLRRLQSLRIERVWPGHGDAFGDAPGVLAARIERCQQRLGQTVALLAAGPQTAWEIAQQLYAGTSAAGSQRGLFQVVAYLDALVARGQAAAEAGAAEAGAAEAGAAEAGDGACRYHAVTVS